MLPQKSKQVYHQEVSRTVKEETGEITKTEVTERVRLPDEPPYIKLYINDLMALTHVPKSCEDVLLALLRKLDWDGYITISTRFRKELCEYLDVKNQTLSNKIQWLVKSGLLKTVGKNEYLANPDFFAKGDWPKIYKRRESEGFVLTIKYNSTGEKRVFTEFTEENEVDKSKH